MGLAVGLFRIRLGFGVVAVRPVLRHRGRRRSTCLFSPKTEELRTDMSGSRRDFLAQSTLGLLGVAVAAHAQTPQSQEPTPGAPPAFGTAPPVGPEVSATTFAEAEKLVQVEMTPADRAEAAENWRMQMAPLYERRTGPRKLAIEASVAPATLWNPTLPGMTPYPAANVFVRRAGSAAPLPASDEDIAFATLTQLSRWVESKQITSERLTEIYLGRIQRFDPKLHCVITLTREHALEQARQADKEIAAGKYRGPLHGIPWGAKDLLDTAGIATTWGAEPYRHRVPTTNATVVERLKAAGAVLVAKLSLGALALNDIWFGGQTMNPWLLEEGASGSSAGPGSATAAGLVGFSVGSETGGSIVSPSMRCGVTGLRPTYGRVPRTGAMTLCWSLDKLGPMARSVEDTMLVLQAITGHDGRDVACVPSHLNFNAQSPATGLRVGYFPQWMKEPPATDVDRATLEALPKLGMTPVEVTLPDWPYDNLDLILFAEGTAAFEEIVLNHQIDSLKAQVPDAWPNTFRQSYFLSAVDLIQTDRLRRMVALEMARIMNEVDLLLVPSLRDEILHITNNTGHPSLTLRTGFVEVSEARSDWAPDPNNPLPKFSPPRRVPHGITLIGRLFDEGTIARVGLALERHFNVAQETPPVFQVKLRKNCGAREGTELTSITVRMANSEHLAKIKAGIESWNEWRKKNPTIQVDLRRAKLHMLDLNRINLSDANLSRATMGGTNLRDADLRGAKLYGTFLSEACLDRVNLSKADLISSNLSKANLREATLTAANLSSADLSQANLNGADLIRANLSQADLRHASLDHADLSEASLIGGDLAEASLNQANLSNARLSGANLRGATLVHANLKKANARGTNLSAANLTHANLTSVNLHSASLQYAKMDDTTLTDACLWETQRGRWSIKGIICERAYWDERDERAYDYVRGEFERLYSDTTRIELLYPGGMTTFELNTLPALLYHLTSKYPNSGIRLKSMEETGGGAKISISVEEADPQAVENIRAEAD